MCGKKCLTALLSLCIIVPLIGCGGGFPDMTEDEYNQTVEYAAGVLMKYSNNGEERLIYVDAEELQKKRKKEEAAAEKENTVLTPPTPPKTVEEPPVEEPVEEPLEEPLEEPSVEEATAEISKEETKPASDDKGGKNDGTDQGGVTDSNAIVLSSDESKEITDDIFLSYQGYMVSSTYPESSKSYVVNADKGKKLLVLRFDLYNASDNDKSVNLIPMNLMFQIVLNDRNIGYSSVTFLPNDLASYSGNIESRAHESVVVLTQINANEATNIESLGLIATRNGKTENIVLR